MIEEGHVWFPDHALPSSNENVAFDDYAEIVGDSVAVTRGCFSFLCTERRFRTDGGYHITVPNGEYEIQLTFVDDHRGGDHHFDDHLIDRLIDDPRGPRVFDIVVEGQILRRQYDIAQAITEGGDIARESLRARVQDGVLNIEFRIVQDHAKISAIEISQLF